MRILILMQSRSGSSLVASILNAHGYNTKHREQINQFGYMAYEHNAAREWLYARKSKMGYAGGRFGKAIKGIEDVFKDGDCVKIGVEYWHCFKHLPVKVFCVRRNPEQIKKSLIEKRNLSGNLRPSTPQSILEIINRRVEMLDQARDESGGVDVGIEQIVAGDFSGLKAAFEHHGMPFDEAKAMACVAPDKFKHR